MPISNEPPDRALTAWSLSKQLSRMTAFEKLAAFSFLMAALVLTWHLGNRLTSSWSCHDASVHFAEKIRDWQAAARKYNSFVHIETLPATPARRSTYLVFNKGKQIEHGEFPQNIFVSGALTIDPQGVPTASARFIFSNGQQKQMVEVNARGQVCLPR